MGPGRSYQTAGIARDPASGTQLLRGEITGLRGDMEAMGGSLRGETAAMGVSLRDEMKALHGITVFRFEKLEKALGRQMTEMEANLTAGFETRIRTTELVLHDHARRVIALETPRS